MNITQLPNPETHVAGLAAPTGSIDPLAGCSSLFMTDLAFEVTKLEREAADLWGHAADLSREASCFDTFFEWENAMFVAEIEARKLENTATFLLNLAARTMGWNHDDRLPRPNDITAWYAATEPF